LLIGSGFPNFDVLPTLLRKETPDNPLNETHAATVLHTIFLYLVILPFMYLGLSTIGWSNAWVIALSFCVGAIVHVLTESFDKKGRRLFWPISNKFYGLKVLPYDFWTYLTDKKVLAFEGGLFMAAFLLTIF